MAGSLVCLPLSFCLTSLSFQVGWRKRPTIDLNPPRRRPHLPCPQPRTAHSGPPFSTLGEGPSLPVAPLSPCGPASSPTPSLPPTFPSLLPLAGFSPPTAPASLPPFSVSLPSLPRDPALYSLPGLFFTPLSPAPWLMPFPVLILNNYQIYQWGERSCVFVVLASQCQGQMVHPLPVPSAGWLT